jgi:myo-inositol-1(or 4)-monophosphatase
MSNVFEKAVAFAIKAHEGQKRKDGSVYILHPLEVAAIAGTMTSDLDILSAAVLHDTVEDTDTTAEDILSNFGERIASLVASETEDKRPDMPSDQSWKIRKVESLEELKNSNDIGVKILWVSDKLSNMRSLYRDFENIGLSVFERFNETDPSEQRWYHGSVLEYTKELSQYTAYREYKKLFELVFDGLK